MGQALARRLARATRQAVAGCAAKAPAARRHGCPTSSSRRSSGALLAGATASGFVGELWTVDRVALVIERLTGVRHHPAHVWALLRHRLGWTVQRPARRAAERDQAAIDQWVARDWPRIKPTPNDAKPAWSSSTNQRSA